MVLVQLLVLVLILLQGQFDWILRMFEYNNNSNSITFTINIISHLSLGQNLNYHNNLVLKSILLIVIAVVNMTIL